MSRRERLVAYHPIFGPVPAWSQHLWFRATMLAVFLGIGLGTGVLSADFAPWPFSILAARLSMAGRAFGIVALFFGSLVGTISFSVLALWQHRFQKSKATLDKS